MSDRFEMALALVNDAQPRLSELQRAYEQSLHAKSVSVDLQIQIKNVMENLRSALDYCACESHERYGTGEGGNV